MDKKETKVEGSETTTFGENKYLKEVEEAKDDPEKEVTVIGNPDNPENAIFAIESKDTEEEKAINNEEKGSIEPETSWKDMLSNATVAEPEKVE